MILAVLPAQLTSPLVVFPAQYAPCPARLAVTFVLTPAARMCVSDALEAPVAATPPVTYSPGFVFQSQSGRFAVLCVWLSAAVVSVSNAHEAVLLRMNPCAQVTEQSLLPAVPWLGFCLRARALFL